MASLQIAQLPYHQHTETWFHLIRELGDAVWLDSGRPVQEKGHFDILTAAPRVRFIKNSEGVCAKETNGHETHYNDIWSAIQAQFNDYGLTQHHPKFPFVGGLMGAFSYDLGMSVEAVNNQRPSDPELPEMILGLYEWAIIQNHEHHQCHLVAQPRMGRSAFNDLKLRLLSQRPSIPKSFKIQNIQKSLSKNAYIEALKKVDDYIHRGDCYQVNFAQHFSAPYQGDPLLAYLSLRKQLPSPFSCYMETEQGTIMSLSPERLLSCQQGLVTAQPIKGTIKRGQNKTEDAAFMAQLQSSKKDRAENLMIVDLLRNDLSKTCKPHSVSTPKLFDLETYANVHHLVSTVTGQLNDPYNTLDLFKGCFPGGSITGAPKKRSMEIINELENRSRSYYCGSIGYMSYCGNMDMNIAIRTLVCDDSNIHCWGGGGIVADSEAESEYQESLTKVGILLETLETFHQG